MLEHIKTIQIHTPDGYKRGRSGAQDNNQGSQNNNTTNNGDKGSDDKIQDVDFEGIK
jgi:hypothetical protein